MAIAGTKLRERSLKEQMEVLPEGHRARKEYESLMRLPDSTLRCDGCSEPFDPPRGSFLCLECVKESACAKTDEQEGPDEAHPLEEAIQRLLQDVQNQKSGTEFDLRKVASEQLRMQTESASWSSFIDMIEAMMREHRVAKAP